ncbi:MAG: hypothetical protein JTT12_05030 [Candidatus Brockarchaeota archaeon]|nr:hypothetical protein [Candidatus Brockarchaeota archaeon]
MSTEVSVTKKGLSTRVLILSLLVILIGIPYSVIVEVVGIGTDSIFFPFILIVLFNAILPKRIRLTPQELAILFIPLFAMAGKAFIVNGDGRERLGATAVQYTLGSLIYAFNNPPYADFYKKVIPSWIFPSGLETIQAWTGRAAVNWGPWIVPIIYWTIFSTSWMIFVIFLVWGLIGPQWTEVERLTFPMAIPSTYLINSLEEQEGKVKLFNIRTNEMKLFWGTFVIGFVVSAVVSLGDILPAFGMYTEVWEKHMNFMFIQSVFGNGAMVNGVLIPHQVMLSLLLPFDVLWTGVLTWVVVGLIYQPLGVRLGFLPYTPGVETYADWYFGELPPWPYQYMALSGLSMSVAIYALWAARDRIRKIYNAMVKEDINESGLSLKLMGWGMVLSAIFLFVFWAISGVPVIMSFIVLFLYILWVIADARVMSEVWWHDPVLWFYSFYLTQPAGAFLGLWPSTVPTYNSGNLMTEQVVAGIGNWIPRHSPMGAGFTTQYYSLAKRTNTDVKEAFYMYVLTAIIGTFVAIVTFVWITTFFGYQNNPGTGSYAISYLTSKGPITGSSLTLTASQAYLWAIVGLLLGFGLYYIRMVFPGFVINPVALIPSLWLMEFMWLACLIALIVKYALVKAVGPARFQNIVVPIAAGLAIGSGFFVWIGPLYKLFTVVIPKLAAV